MKLTATVLFSLLLSLSFMISAQDDIIYKSFKLNGPGTKGFSIETQASSKAPRRASFVSNVSSGEMAFDKVYITINGQKYLFDEKVHKVFKTKNKIFLLVEDKSKLNLKMMSFSVQGKQVVKTNLPHFHIKSTADFLVGSFTQYRDSKLGGLSFYQVIETSPNGTKNLVSTVVTERGFSKTWLEPYRNDTQSGEVKFTKEKILNASSLSTYDGITITNTHRVPLVEIEKAHAAAAQQAKAQQLQSQVAQANPTFKEVSSSMRDFVSQIKNRIGYKKDVDFLRTAIIEQLEYFLIYDEVKPIIVLEGQGNHVDEILELITKNNLTHEVLDFKAMNYQAADFADRFLTSFNNAILNSGDAGYISLKNWEYAPESLKKMINNVITSGEYEVSYVLQNGQTESSVVNTKRFQFLKRTTLVLDKVQGGFKEAVNDIRISGKELASLDGHKAVLENLKTKRVDRDSLMRDLVKGKIIRGNYLVSFIDEDVTKAARIEIDFPQTKYEFLNILEKEYKNEISKFKTKYTQRFSTTSVKQFLSVVGELYHPTLDSNFTNRIMSMVKTQFAQKSLEGFAKGNKVVNLKLDLDSVATVLKSDCNLYFNR